MAGKIVKFDTEARNSMLKGVDMLANAVNRSTEDPPGPPLIISSGSSFGSVEFDLSLATNNSSDWA